MPTVAMMEELLRECYWVWTTTYNGKSVKGYIAYKAKYDGDKGQLISSYFTPSPNYDVARDTHLFFPAPGKHIMTGFDTEDDSGAYWSRSLDKKISHLAFCLGLNNYVYIGSGARFPGLPVRPVCHKGDE